MRLGVVTPLANEEDCIHELLDRTLAQLGPDDRMFCVLDNVSKDRTRELILARAETEPRVALVWAPENRCVVDAYFRGYRAALAAGAKWVLEMDGGLSHQPEEIPLFVREMEKGFEYVGGCRFMTREGYTGPWSRYLISRGGGALANLLLGTHMIDMTGGFECFSRRALEAVLAKGVRSRAHFFQTEIKVLMHQFKWTEVPIHYKNPSKSVGQSSLKEAFRNLWVLFRERRFSALKPAPVAPPQPASAPAAPAAPAATNTKLVSVVTTIQEPTACVKKLGAALAAVGSELIAIGDKKGPAKFEQEGATFVPLSAQQKLPFRMAQSLPVGHYARKNLGYLLAVERGAECIYETDDDNAPNAHWKPRAVTTRAQAAAPRVWMNVYRAFSKENIWPRGLPLDQITKPLAGAHDPHAPEREFYCPIQQGLADNAPDVDAVWRLVLDRPFTFDRGPSVWLPPGTWCPFNSQTTWWWPEVYPLLYLPSYCSFRMTDIWRSFVAQRCLWELGHGLVFHAAEADQDRNAHNLVRDFKDEIPGYTQNDGIVAKLTETSLKPGVGAVADNLVRCYEALTAAGYFPATELPLVRDWVADLATVTAGARAGTARAA